MLASGNRAYGLEVTIRDDGSAVYSYCEVQKIKETLQPIYFQASIDEVEKVKNLLKNDFPIILVINGRSVLQKSLDNLVNPAIQQFFPGTAANDFYYDHITNNNQAIGYIIRRKNFNDLTENLLKSGLNIISAYIGSAVVGHVLPYIAEEIQHRNLTINGTEFSISDEQELSTGITDYIKVGTDEIPSSCFAAYCAALTYFLPLENSGIDYPVLVNKRKEFESQKQLNQYALIFLCIVLALLLLASVLKFQFTANADELRFQSATLGDNKSRDSIISLIKEKKKFLKDGNWTSTSRISFYADRIANSIESVRLTGINIFPKYKLNEDEDSKFKQNSIHITGLAGDELQLKRWIDKLKLEDWVNSASVENYEWDLQNKQGKFEIVLQLK